MFNSLEVDIILVLEIRDCRLEKIRVRCCLRFCEVIDRFSMGDVKKFFLDLKFWYWFLILVVY